jgi:ABC-type transport system involved in multi-copper enzyme maturation permease subunit
MNDRFGWLLRAEWTKFRTVRGWIVGICAAAGLMVGFGLLGAAGNQGPARPDGADVDLANRAAPVGPDGTSVNDHFYFVHRSLTGDGSITVRVTSLTETPLDGMPKSTQGRQPWTKAGVIVKESTVPGSAYAAAMVMGGHGVRMQYNYTGDIAGPASSVSPQWLRLARAGDTLTGYASPDGTAWSDIGRVRLAGLPDTVQIGLFVASPGYQVFAQHLGGISSAGFPTLGRATFDNLGVDGQPGVEWKGVEVGGDTRMGSPETGSFEVSGGTYTVRGSGNMAPEVATERTIERTLVGAFIALTVLVVIAVLFVTTEYRRGLIRTSLAASPRRGRILAAKAIVIGGVTFVVGLVAAAITLPLAKSLLRDNGVFLVRASTLTEVRIVVGTAALLAVVAVLALALGTILRRSVGAVAAAILLTVLPYLLTVAGVLPVVAAQWVLRLTPAAAFAVQQSIPAYPQVDQAYTPAFGFYPLAPWAGFAVLCGWTAVALGLAGHLLRRRDA